MIVLRPVAGLPLPRLAGVAGDSVTFVSSIAVYSVVLIILRCNIITEVQLCQQ